MSRSLGVHKCVFSGITGKSFNRELEVRVADDVANDVADEFAGDVANEVADEFANDVANEVAGDVADDSTDEAADAIIFEVVKVIICFETKVSVGVFEKDVAEADDDADWEHVDKDVVGADDDADWEHVDKDVAGADDDADWEHVDKAPVKRKPMVYKHLHYSLF